MPRLTFIRSDQSGLCGRGEWLYLSRIRLEVNLPRVQHEDLLEHALAFFGWRVIDPQALSLATQSRHLRRASVIADP